MKQETKNQHFLPRAYLSGFAADASKYGNKHVQVYRQNIPKWNAQAIKHTASALYRHSYQLPDGTYDHSPDDQLGAVEDYCLPVVARLRKMAEAPGLPPNLSKDDRLTFATFVMHMFARTPRQTQATTKFLNQVEELRFALRSYNWGRSDNPDAHKALQFAYPTGKPDVAGIPAAIDMTVEPSIESAEVLALLNWNFMRTTPDAPFVTCDSPVVRTHGLADLRCIVTMPVSATLAFLAWHQPISAEWFDVAPDYVTRFNINTLSAALQMIIASRTDYPGADQSVPEFYSPPK